MRTIPWFERTFEASTSSSSLPNVCARLRGAPPRVEDVLRNAPGELRTRRYEGGWSAQENAGHLVDLEPLWLARVEDYVGTSEELTPTDLANRKTDEANHNERALEEIFLEFRLARLRLIEFVLTLNSSSFRKKIPHPRLKQPMGLMDHLYFVAEHDDHHLARIWELVLRESIPLNRHADFDSQ